jgi:hypothetical protein
MLTVGSKRRARHPDGSPRAYPWCTTLSTDVRDAALPSHIGRAPIASSDFTDAARPRGSFSRHSACCSNCGCPQGGKMTEKINRLAIAGRAPWPKRDSLFFDSTPFMSMCPTCSEPRLQLGYSPGGLLRRINGDRPIEACCVICNQFWPLTAQDRVRLTKELEHLRLS